MGNVRSHTRTVNGKTQRVQQHHRQGRPRKGLVSPGHAWSLAKRSWKFWKRHKKGAAVTLGVLAVGELGSWLVLDTAGKVLSLAAFGLLLGAGAAFGATGRDA